MNGRATSPRREASALLPEAGNGILFTDNTATVNGDNSAAKAEAPSGCTAAAPPDAICG